MSLRRVSHARWFAIVVLSGVMVGLLTMPLSAADKSDLSKSPPEVIVTKTKLPSVFGKEVPEGVEDLLAIQNHVKRVLDKVIPATVCVRVGPSQGSGVIVSEDGYILTAGHVSGDDGRNVTVILPNGRQVKGKTLGANRGIDSGMIKITTEGKWPFVNMGEASDLKKGQWVISTGHPGGYKKGRTPVVRLGRIQNTNSRIVQTDCTLVGGDSGGPLFDMHGNVIGIHSRISGPITSNIHVPVDTYRDTWDRLADSEVWGSLGGRRRPASAYMGVQLAVEGDTCRIREVVEDSPAEKAGLQVDDILDRFEGKRVSDLDDLIGLLSKKKPGDKVVLEIMRDDKPLKIELTLGKRNS